MAGQTPLPKTWKLPEAFARRFGQAAGRQRLMAHEGHLLLVLHRVPDADTPDRDAVLFWRSPEGEWKTTDHGAGLASLKDHVKSYMDAVEALEKQVDAAQTADTYFKVLNSVSPLLRSATHMLQVLQEAREKGGDDKLLITLRDQAIDIQRSAELTQTEAKNGLDYAIARRAEEQARAGEAVNRASHRLNLLAAFFLPITALASILGMNVVPDMDQAMKWVVLMLTVVAGLAFGLILMAAIAGGAKRE